MLPQKLPATTSAVAATSCRRGRKTEKRELEGRQRKVKPTKTTPALWLALCVICIVYRLLAVQT